MGNAKKINKSSLFAQCDNGFMLRIETQVRRGQGKETKVQLRILISCLSWYIYGNWKEQQNDVQNKNSLK